MSDRAGERFLGRPDDYLTWAAEHFTAKGQWCARHWMPAPVEGRNGLLASVLLMQEAPALMPDDVRTPEAMNSWMANLLEPICCKLGDERMAAIWAQCPGVARG